MVRLVTVCKICGQIDMLDGPEICLECAEKIKNATEEKSKEIQSERSGYDSKWFFIRSRIHSCFGRFQIIISHWDVLNGIFRKIS